MEARTKPGEWLEQPWAQHSGCGIVRLVADRCLPYLTAGRTGRSRPEHLQPDFLTVGILLHSHPKRFMRAVTACIPVTGGVLIQFPFCAVIFGMILGTGISDWLARLFAAVTTHSTFPPAGRHLFRRAGRLCSVGRQQVGD